MVVVLSDGTFGGNIQYLRGKKNMSRHQLAETLGIHEEKLAAIEAGRELDIESGLLRRICAARDGDIRAMSVSPLDAG